MCSGASIGTSPSRKYKVTIGWYLLSFNIDQRIFLWKVVSVLIIAGLMGSADNSDRNTGLIKTDNVLYCTWGESLLEIFPRNPKIESLAARIFLFTFLISSSTPETFNPRCSLSSVICDTDCRHPDGSDTEA